MGGATNDERVIPMPGAQVGEVVGVGDQHLVGGAHDARRWCVIIAQLGGQLGFPACRGAGGDLVGSVRCR